MVSRKGLSIRGKLGTSEADVCRPCVPTTVPRFAAHTVHTEPARNDGRLTRSSSRGSLLLIRRISGAPAKRSRPSAREPRGNEWRSARNCQCDITASRLRDVGCPKSCVFGQRHPLELRPAKSGTCAARTTLRYLLNCQRECGGIIGLYGLGPGLCGCTPVGRPADYRRLRLDPSRGAERHIRGPGAKPPRGTCSAVGDVCRWRNDMKRLRSIVKC